MNAADIMTPDVISATPETPLLDLVRLMLDHHVSALPIVEGGSIVGIVSEGDLMRRAKAGTEPRPSRWLELVTSTDRLATDYTRTHGLKAGEIMTREVVTVADTAPLAEVAHLLETRRIKRVTLERYETLMADRSYWHGRVASLEYILNVSMEDREKWMDSAHAEAERLVDAELLHVG